MVNGNLALNGSTLDITALSGFGAGTYELFNYTGSLTGTLNLGPLPTGFTAADFSIQTSIAGQVDLIVTGGTGFQLQYWNGSTVAANGSVAGGSGTWDNARTNWTNGAGTISATWAQSVAVFSNGGGISSSPATITLGDNITAGELRFTAGSGAYKISVSPGDTLTINGTGIRNSSGVAQSFVTAVDGGGKYGSLTFANSATAGTAQITNSGATVTGVNGGATVFIDASIADSATIANLAGTKPSAAGGTITFGGTASAGGATIANVGAAYNGGVGGATTFLLNATAGGAVIVNEGSSSGSGSILSRGTLSFSSTATAGNATINNNGATSNGGLGLHILFG